MGAAGEARGPLESGPDLRGAPPARLSATALVLANLVPLAGALFLGWSVGELMLLFWAENVILGAYNVLRLIAARPWDPAAWASKLFLVPFFAVHYGGFCLGHGAFIVTLFLAREGLGELGSLGELRAHLAHLVWPLAGLTLSHGVSFVGNYLRRGEYLLADPNKLMFQPYARIMLLHVVLLLGGILLLFLGAPVVLLALLVVLKIVLDLRAHLAEHSGQRGQGARPQV